MSEICVIPTFRRNELLYLCLESIRAQAPDMRVCVLSDHGVLNLELECVCEKFGADLEVTEQHPYYGNSFNVISALHWGTAVGTQIVHLVEDDTILHSKYFDWARNALLVGLQSQNLASRVDAPNWKTLYAAVCGRIASPHITNWYESPCASWNASCLKQCLDLIPKGYFTQTRQEMCRVLDLAFPRSKYKGGGCEQDGFFLRCIERFDWRTKFPDKPLATHGGHYGYNRPNNKPPTGTFEERVQFTRDLLKDKRRRIELFGESITEKEMA